MTEFNTIDPNEFSATDRVNADCISAIREYCFGGLKKFHKRYEKQLNCGSSTFYRAMAGHYVRKAIVHNIEKTAESLNIYSMREARSNYLQRLALIEGLCEKLDAMANSFTPETYSALLHYYRQYRTTLRAK